MADREEQETQALAALNELIAELGLGFHPERPVASYVKTGEGTSADAQLLEAIATVTGEEYAAEEWLAFEPRDAERLQAGLDLAWEVWGEGVFDVIKTIEPWKTYFEEQEKETE